MNREDMLDEAIDIADSIIFSSSMCYFSCYYEDLRQIMLSLGELSVKEKDMFLRKVRYCLNREERYNIKVTHR